MSKLLKEISYEYHYHVDGIPVCVIVLLMVLLCANPPNDIQNSNQFLFVLPANKRVWLKQFSYIVVLL